MTIDFSKWGASDYAAWWGAVIATFAFVWNIVLAIRSGPRIKLFVNPNMQIWPQDPKTKGKSYVSVRAVNTGTSPTTITHFAGFHASNRLDLVQGKKQNFVVNSSPLLGQDIPFKLLPGEEWSNMTDQDDLKEKFPGGYIYVGIIHNQRAKPIMKRVKI